MIFYHITPDRMVDNDGVDALATMLTNLYSPPIKRMEGIRIRPMDSASWDIHLEKDNSKWQLAVPVGWSEVVDATIRSIWPRATVKQGTDCLDVTHPRAAGTLSLRNHYMFRLRVDRRSSAPLAGILDVLRRLAPGEVVGIQALMTPAPPDWWEIAGDAYEQYRKGVMPQRIHLDSKMAQQAVLKVMAGTIFTMMNIAEELAGAKPTDYSLNNRHSSRVQSIREGSYSFANHGSIPQKLKESAFETTIRIAVDAEPNKAQAILRSIAQAFRELDADNAFLLTESKDPEKTYTQMSQRYQQFKLNHDYLCVSEVSRLLQLPFGTMQKEFQLESVAHRETNLPSIVLEGGLLLGQSTYHGETRNVYLPKRDYDNLCLPHIAIGGMGQGKTRGFGANLMVEAVENGFSAVAIDPAKGEIFEEVSAALRPDQIHRIKLGEKPICLDWREALRGERGRNRLAQELISFVEAASDEAGAQTVRYLRAAARAVPTGKLSEVMRLLSDTGYRADLIETLTGPEKLIWKEYHEFSVGKQANIAGPVLNRLDVVMGDEYLAECMEADEGIDLIELIDSGPKAIIIDIPKKELGTDGVDILAALMATKLDLAMVMRKTEYPVFVVQDEPHQYLRGAKTWKAAVVESRKWRFCYTWLFHAWEQLPTDLRAIIQSALPHYHVYPSSKMVYRALQEELMPFSLDELMALPKYHAVNVLRAGSSTIPPFICKMALPPSKRSRARYK